MSEEKVLNNEELEVQENLPEEPVENELLVEESEELTETEPLSEEPSCDGESEEIPEPANEDPEETTEETSPNEPEPETPSAEENSKVQSEVGPKPYHERYYLKYREGKRSTALDLDGTKAFLQELGFDGGELRKARAGKDFAEAFRNSDNGNVMRCSYCGSEISGVEFYRLPDGRMRCTMCSNTIVKTKAEIEELCQRVITNMDNFFGATLDVPVSIEVLEERKIKRRLGVPIGAKDDQSILILGVAINKNKKYKILLENGAPRISLIATFAHELTHIWQYTHWDRNRNMKKCAKSKRLLIYEGMAKWAEIQYLYLIGETNIARREEYITRNRQDEYGIGFCLYEDIYPLSREAMNIEETPFIADRYPL